MKKTLNILDDLNVRLDIYLTKELEKSRNFVQEYIKSGDIKVNGMIVKTGYLLKKNDLIEIDINESKPASEEPIFLDLDIVYQDEDIAIINKPKGLVVHPASSYKGHTLVNALLAQIDNLSSINGVIRPGIVHRIDKDTSGLLVVAKNDDAHNFLANELKSHNIKRYYYALVYGAFDEDEGVIDAPIGRSNANRLKNTVTSTGKNAITYFKVIKRFKDYSLLELELKTGRTHQIRVHMEYINHHIVGDPLYGKKEVILDYGQFLHAFKLELVHPKTKKEMTFTCDLPDYFKDFLETLEV